MNTETLAEQKAERKRIFDCGVKNSLLTGEHAKRMADAVWLFMLLVDFVTEEVSEDGERLGKVHGAVPRSDSYLASALGVTERTIRRWRQRLTREGYIKSVRTGYGHKLYIRKSKKWTVGKPDKSGQSGPERTDRVGHSDRPNQSVRLTVPVSQSDRIGRSNKTGHWTLQKQQQGGWFSVLPKSIQLKAREAGKNETDEWANPPRHFESWFAKHSARLALVVVDEEIYSVKERIGDYQKSDKAARQTALTELRKMREAIPKQEGDEGEPLSDDEFNQRERERLFGAKESESPRK